MLLAKSMAEESDKFKLSGERRYEIKAFMTTVIPWIWTIIFIMFILNKKTAYVKEILFFHICYITIRFLCLTACRFDPCHQHHVEAKFALLRLFYILLLSILCNLLFLPGVFFIPMPSDELPCILFICH